MQLLEETSVVILEDEVGGTPAAVAECTFVLEARSVSPEAFLQIRGLAEGTDPRSLTVSVIHLSVLLVIGKLVVIAAPETRCDPVQFFFRHRPSAICHDSTSVSFINRYALASIIIQQLSALETQNGQKYRKKNLNFYSW